MLISKFIDDDTLKDGRGEIADFILEKVNGLILEEVEGVTEDMLLYIQDISVFKELKNAKEYIVVENTFSTKSRIEYICGIKREDRSEKK